MAEEFIDLKTCYYGLNSKNLKNSIKVPESNQTFQPTQNPKIKIIFLEQQPIQQQQESISSQTQPNQLNQIDSSNQQDNNLEYTSINKTTIYQQNFNLDQTLMKTTIQICKNCALSINRDCISLPCFHSYHKDCLHQIVQSNIEIDQVSILCLCKLKIPQHLILQIVKDNKQLRKKYFMVQLFEIISRASPQVQQSLFGQTKYTQSSLKTLLNQLMIEDDTPQKILKK